jgi:NhaP-type Na+/H+ or K+/H+ antiporter
LPLIIFNTGYNMRRQKFFENITNIAKFGLLGTFLTFVFYSLFTYLLFYFNDGYLWAYDFDATNITGNDKTRFKFKLDVWQILFVCSIYSSSDIIAAVTIIKFDEQPVLFSLILGEGLFNDAVAIILYQTMKEFLILEKDPDVVFNTNDKMVYLQVVWHFIYLSVSSVIIGVVCGLVGALMTKHMRFISHSAIGEGSLIISLAMIGYFISEIFELSGIVSLLMTAIVMS